MRENIFAQNLKMLFKEQRLTQKQLARALNLDQSSISCLLNGITTPKYFTLIDIANHFNVSLDWLCGKSDYRKITKDR